MADQFKRTDVVPYPDDLRQRLDTPVPRSETPTDFVRPMGATREGIEHVLTPDDIVAVLAREAAAHRGNGEDVWYQVKHRIKGPPPLKGATLEHVAEAMRRAGFAAWKASEPEPPSFDSLVNNRFVVDGYCVAQMREAEAQRTGKGEMVLWLEKRVDEFDEEWETRLVSRDPHADDVIPLAIEKSEKIPDLEIDACRLAEEIARDWNATHDDIEHIKEGDIRWLATKVLARRGYSVRRDGKEEPVEIRDMKWKFVNHLRSLQ